MKHVDIDASCKRHRAPVQSRHADGDGPVTRGVYLLLAAQFVSGLADNALLLVTIARLIELDAAAWLAPLLKFLFTLAYVFLAPFVGLLADRWAKASVMFQSNAIKASGVLMIGIGVHPLAAFTVAGAGAALYSPAKYGLITELVPPADLVRANGWIEVTTVCAILLGTVLGGLLVSPAVTQSATLAPLAALMPVDTALAPSLLCVLALYLLAAALNLLIPRHRPRYHPTPLRPGPALRRFAHANRTLWRDPLGGLSLAVTTLFWGVGATLQFIVLAWAQDRLELGLDQAAYLQGVVALGIVGGAFAAGRLVALRRAPAVLPLGIVMGLGVPLMTLVSSVPLAIPLLATVGALAGYFVVPMNALLQHRGYTLLNAGESIAVQNFNENLAVLAMLALYTALLAAQWHINTLIFALGALVAVVIALVMWHHRRRSPGSAPGAGIAGPSPSELPPRQHPS